MIGNQAIKNRVQELLATIAKNNKENYGHILSLCPSNNKEIIYLGYSRDDEENCNHVLKWDSINDIIYDTDGSEILLSDYDFFELSINFERDLKEAQNGLNELLNKATKEEIETVDRLRKIIKTE